MLDIIRGQVFYIHYVWNQDAPIATQDMNETQHKADYVEKPKQQDPGLKWLLKKWNLTICIHLNLIGGDLRWTVANRSKKKSW